MTKHFRYAAQAFVAIMFSVSSLASSVDFFRAIEVDNERALRRLLAEGFDPNSRDERGQVGLYLALRTGSPKAIAVLIGDPATRIDEPNAAGETPLMMAALRGDLDWVVRLIERGARVQRPGWSPVLYAASGPEPRAVALLLDRGAAIESRSPNGTTPLMMAAGYGAEDSVNLLLARGADPKARNDNGLSPADFARIAGREKLAARLQQSAQ